MGQGNCYLFRKVMLRVIVRNDERVVPGPIGNEIVVKRGEFGLDLDLESRLWAVHGSAHVNIKR